MATKTPIPLAQIAFLTPSGRVSDPWRQYLLALGDADGNAGTGDFGPILIALAELRQQDAATVSVPSLPAGRLDEIVASVIANAQRSEQRDSSADLAMTHGIQDQSDLHATATQTDAGFMSAADKAKLDGVNAIPAQSLTADVTASNTASDVTVLTETLPANAARAGMQRRFSMYCLVSNGTTAGTLQIWVKLGTTKVFTHAFTSPTTAATNKGLFVAFEWCFRTIGASGSLQVSGTLFTNDTPAVTLTPDSLVTPASINTTISQTFTFGFNWLAANASNSVTAKSASLVGVV
ncbi:hypothetical protein [Caballeronia sp. LZ001]|uniref:hypothetical protein n=1 Tax=Caballeronia sp. LZ001 TaxID=3038553 RepID=UPI002856B2D7|nr:hypothetical protein [Caballeronia sp. LZ001]MDR5802134.1 hypothetical protein [Caballeronia sp. LZ001]